MPSIKQLENDLLKTNIKIGNIQFQISFLKKQQKQFEKDLKKAQSQEIQEQELITNIQTQSNSNDIDFSFFKKQGLSNKEAIFAVAFLTNDHNRTQAYLTAYPKSALNTAATEGHKFLKKPNVAAAIQAYINEHLDIEKMTLEKDLVKMYKTLAFYDPGKILNANGTLRYKNIDDVPEDLRKCIEGIKTYVNANWERKEVKLVSRFPALEKLAGYIQMIKEQEQSLELKMTEETAGKLADIFRGKK